MNRKEYDRRRYLNSKREVILLFGDMHIPYEHQDMMKFLKAVKKKYKPQRVICMGDEVDNHAISFHDSEPELPGAGDELNHSIFKMKKLYKLFPKVDVLNSNHGSLVFRRGKNAKLLEKMMRTPKEILEAPVGWNWHNELYIKMINGMTLYCTHGKKKNTFKFAEDSRMCIAQGHFHEDSYIKIMHSNIRTIWAASVGCLVDDKSRAFNYNKLWTKEPALSCVVVINGMPRLIPMRLNKEFRWDGNLV